MRRGAQLTRATGAAVLVVAAALPVSVATAPGACAAPGPDQVRVAVVVDTGDPGADVRPVCVSVPNGASGLDVLATRAHALRLAAPRFAPSGLLCAIDGVPATGCGEPTASGYRYWSYWQGERGTWSYASAGPGVTPVRPARVEGWRFVEGKADGSEPGPRARPDAGASCAALLAARADRGGGTGTGPGSNGPPFGVIIGGSAAGGLLFAAARTRRRRARDEAA